MNQKANRMAVLACALALSSGAAYAQATPNNKSASTCNPVPIVFGIGILSPDQIAQSKADFKCRLELDKKAAGDMKARDYAAAEIDARIALGVGGDGGEADMVLAEALELQGKDDQALVQFKKLADKRESRPRYLLPYAGLLLKAGRIADAVAVYNKAERPFTTKDAEEIKNGSSSSNDPLRENFTFSADALPDAVTLATAIHIALGIEMDEVGDNVPGGGLQTDLAMDQYAQALQLMPDSDVAQYYYGFGLEKQNRLLDAGPFYAKAAGTRNAALKAAASKGIDRMNRLIYWNEMHQAKAQASH